jgi:hypothetical protein
MGGEGDPSIYRLWGPSELWSNYYKGLRNPGAEPGQTWYYDHEKLSTGLPVGMWAAYYQASKATIEWKAKEVHRRKLPPVTDGSEYYGLGGNSTPYSACTCM